MHHSRLASASRALIFGLAAAFIVLPSIRPIAASATSYPLKITNVTDHDTWVTVYWAYKLTGWHIERAFCLKPGEKWAGNISYSTPEVGPEIKVRGEVKNGDCRAGNLRDVEARADIPTNYKPYAYVAATINGYRGNYSAEVKTSILPI